jgi:hypothetical protein
MKKHHWYAFWHEKLFEKHSQPHCQIRSKTLKKRKLLEREAKGKEEEEEDNSRCSKKALYACLL